MSFRYQPEEDITGGSFRITNTKDDSVSIFEDTGIEGSGIGAFAAQQIKASAMSLALAWVEMGEHSYSALESSALAIADLDDSGDIDDSEEEYVNELLSATMDAFVSLGGDSGNVASFVNDEDDAAGATLGAFLSDKMDGTETDDETLIANYAAGSDQVLESVKKAVRGGKVTFIRKKIRGRHAKLNALQRAGLKKARSKAFTSAAKVPRKKSFRLGQKMGIHK